MQRGKDKVIEVGSCSKSERLPARSAPIFSPRVLRPSTRQKRKQQQQARDIRAKVNKNSNKAQEKKARLVTNLEGLVEVHVSYEHCSRLAAGLGFNTTQIQ